MEGGREEREERKEREKGKERKLLTPFHKRLSPRYGGCQVQTHMGNKRQQKDPNPDQGRSCLYRFGLEQRAKMSL